MPYKDPEVKRAYMKAYMAAYRETHKEERRAYYAANREVLLEWQREYNAIHKEERKAYHNTVVKPRVTKVANTIVKTFSIIPRTAHRQYAERLLDKADRSDVFAKAVRTAKVDYLLAGAIDG